MKIDTVNYTMLYLSVLDFEHCETMESVFCIVLFLLYHFDIE